LVGDLGGFAVSLVDQEAEAIAQVVAGLDGQETGGRGVLVEIFQTEGVDANRP